MSSATRSCAPTPARSRGRRSRSGRLGSRVSCFAVARLACTHAERAIRDLWNELRREGWETPHPLEEPPADEPLPDYLEDEGL